MVTMTASHIKQKKFLKYNFGYNLDYIKQWNAPLVLILKSMFIYNIWHPNDVKLLTLVIMYSI